MRLDHLLSREKREGENPEQDSLGRSVPKRQRVLKGLTRSAKSARLRTAQRASKDANRSPPEDDEPPAFSLMYRFEGSPSESSAEEQTRYAKPSAKRTLKTSYRTRKRRKSSKASKTVKVSGTERFQDRKIQRQSIRLRDQANKSTG